MHRIVAQLRAQRALFSSVIVLLALFSGCVSSASQSAEQAWMEHPGLWTGTVTYTEAVPDFNLTPVGVNGLPSTGSYKISYTNSEKFIITAATMLNAPKILLHGTLTQNAILTYSNHADTNQPGLPCSHSTSTYVQTATLTSQTTVTGVTLTIAADTSVSEPQPKAHYIIDFDRKTAMEQALTGKISRSIEIHLGSGPSNFGCGRTIIEPEPDSIASPDILPNHNPGDVEFSDIVGNKTLPNDLHIDDHPHHVHLADSLDYTDAVWTPQTQLFQQLPHIPVDQSLAWDISFIANS